MKTQMHTDKEMRMHTDMARKVARISVCIFFISVCICVLSYAALDIFDRPRDAERKTKVARVGDEFRFLEYPRECLLKGNYQEAFLASKRLIENPLAKRYKEDAMYLAGLSALKLGRFLEARSYFNNVLLIESKKEDLKRDALLGIGESYFLEGSFNKAYEAYNQILTRYPESPVNCTVYYRMGEVLSGLGRKEEAKYYLDKVQKEFPFSFETRLAAKPPARLAGIMETQPPDTNSQVYTERIHSVQIGGFNEKANADQICEKLVKEGYDAYILEFDKDNSPRFKVRVGRFSSKEEAQRLEAKLKKAGYSTKIYP